MRFIRSLPIAFLLEQLHAQTLHDKTCSRLLVRAGLWAHLFDGVACSCEACAGVRIRDEYAPWPGSLTPCSALSLLDGCLGTCTSVSTLPRCRTRTPREATRRPASSVNTSWMQDPNPYCSANVPSMPSANSEFPTLALHKQSTCGLSYSSPVIWK